MSSRRISAKKSAGLSSSLQQPGLGDALPRRVLQVAPVEPVQRPTAPTGRAGRRRRRRPRRRGRARGPAGPASARSSMASTSRRTARPKRRRRSSTSTAASRSSASFSSRVRSALRVTRKAANSTMCMPGNSSSRWAAMTCSRGTNVEGDPGMRTKRSRFDGHLDPGEAVLTGLGVVDRHGEAERQVRDVGEGVAGVDGERGEHGEDVLVEDLEEGLARVVVEIAPGTEVDPLLGQGGEDLLEEDALLLGTEVDDVVPDQQQLLGRGAPVVRRLVDTRVELVLEAGDPHLEELVQVRLVDGEELGPLEQRHRRDRRRAPARGR